MPGTILNVSPSGVAGSVSAIGVAAGLVVADEELHRPAVRLSDASNVIVALLACGDSKLGVGSNAFEPPGLAAPEPRPRRGERVPEQRLVGAAEADQVGREHRVARVDHAHRAARHQQPRVEHELHPAPVARAGATGVSPSAHDRWSARFDDRVRPVVRLDERRRTS